jgi:hypothetical protein
VADLNELIRKIKRVNIHDKVTQRVLESVHVDTDKRIFKQGKAADNSKIGTYTKPYVKYGRRHEGWGPSRKVILQLTSQMVNDYKFLVLSNGNYGSGFSNTKNFDKSEWVESTYKKEIFALTDQEEKSIDVRIDKELTKFLAKL